MNDFYEVDLWEVETAKSGDAISVRYFQNGAVSIHIVDGGFVESGQVVVDKVKKYYGNPSFIDNVVITHPDGDHAGGLRSVLSIFDVGTLWMNRPWMYSSELISRFSRFTSVDNLTLRLRELYPNLVELERLALEKGIPIKEAFQGTTIGAFKVLAPTRTRFLDLIVGK
jgi:glyoxylase-like metal-dependent hydrolase (beta-lactamase superfamily II)